MEIPAPIVAFLKAIDDRAGVARPDFSISIDGWMVQLRGRDLAYLMPEEKHLCGIACLANGCAIGGIARPTPDARARREKEIAEKEAAARYAERMPPRPPTDVASLSRPMPAFDDDPLAPEDETAPGGPVLTDRARAEFAAATAPKPDAS